MSLFRVIAALLVGLFIYGGSVVIANRTNNHIRIEILDDAAGHADAVSDTLTVTTWNLGYGGLGAESDFVADGGESLLPPSSEIVEKNIQGIVEAMTSFDSDFIILQEAARSSFLTRGGDVLAAVNGASPNRNNAFSADFSIRYLPGIMSPQHGLFSSVNTSSASRELIALPHEPGYLMGLAKRLYHMHVTRLPASEGDWTIINVHLSAFDDGANIRLQQIRAVLAFAESEFAKGRFVVIGGDWNFEFTQPGRPTTTREEHLFWIHPFPFEELKEGWRTAIDPATPSVRTNERPYVKGENYTTVIDGFVVSPNVNVVNVKTRDLDFQFTDHQPVTAQFQRAD